MKNIFINCNHIYGKEKIGLYEWLLRTHYPIIVDFIFVFSYADIGEFNDNIYSAREKQRRLERIWRKDQLEIHRQLYRDQHQLVVRLIQDVKKTYYNNLVDQQKSDSEHLFKVPKQLMHLDKDLPLPKSSPLET